MSALGSGLLEAPSLETHPVELALVPPPAESVASPWWRSASIYQIYVRSFCDSNGDGIGDLGGVAKRLLYVASLGVDAIWLTPFFRSPMVDGAYDVVDYRSVDPLFGELEVVDQIIADAHRLGIRVLVEVVPNHVSAGHEWFQNAVSDRTHPDRLKFHFRDPARGGGPPNNWHSVFGGPAWSFEPSGEQYYLHLFAKEQPDLNWNHPEVRAEFDETLRFWLDRGVDGFRVDVAHGLCKDARYRDNPEVPTEVRGGVAQSPGERHSWNQPEVHAIYRGWRRLLSSYPGDRVMLGEVGLSERDQVAKYVRPDEFPLAYEFEFLWAPWDAEATKATIDDLLSSFDKVGALPTWVLSNHDAGRVPGRYGGGEQGLRRARAKAVLEMALPGAVIVYNGEELGLDDVEVSAESAVDPIALVSGVPGRDAGRGPMPWSASERSFGFSEGEPWLAMPEHWGELCVDAQRQDGRSTLWLYRNCIGLRRTSSLGSGELRWLDTPRGVLAFERASGRERTLCVTNFSNRPVDLPAGDVVLCSGELFDGRLPPDTACWIRTDDEGGGSLWV